jgi:hypothetical protein
MNLRAYWQFYKTIFPFIAAFSIISIAFAGYFWGFVLFATLGLPFGFLGFQVFHKEQFYFYYNLGQTKWRLFKASFLINLLVGIPVFSILILFITFIVGDFQIT